MKLFLTLLFFLLKVASGAVVDNLQFEALDILRLKSTNPRHNNLVLENYLKKQNLVELFVRKLYIDGEDCGPTYFNLQPETEEFHGLRGKYLYYFVKGLDFGEIPQYFGLKADDKDAVLEMKMELVIKRDIFCWSNVQINHIIVNGVDYGTGFLMPCAE